MEYLQLGKTGLKVSPVCLGAAQFGTGVSRKDALRQLDAFTDMGANFIDTAKVYGDWEEGEKSRSEKLIGEWLGGGGKRDKLVIMTKGAHPLLETMHISRCTPDDIQIDINDSLVNLRVEYIDMYLLHRDNPALPAGLLLEALEKERRAGKIRHYGFSNWRLPRIVEAEAYARKAGIEGFSCNQVMWSLAETAPDKLPDKTMVLLDRESYGWHCASCTSATFYHSTAGGWFTKLEKGIEASEKQRSRYENDTNRKIYERIQKVTRELGLSALEISLAYMKAHPFPSVPITSFSRKEQLHESLTACEAVLPRPLVNDLNILKGLEQPGGVEA